MELTEEQQRIIHHGDGHAKVSAVAGSGKTTTMIARIGYLLKQGVEAGQILVLMFNRSARDSFEQSMNDKLASLGQPLPEIRTFHSFGFRLVNSFSRRGALPAYRLVTEDFVQERLARQVAGEVYRRTDGEGYLAGEDVEAFLAFIEQVKGDIRGAKSVFADSDFSERLGFFPEAFELFEQVRKQQRLRFFSDLIYEPLHAMLSEESGTLLRWVADRVDHILVDEYQDINEVQQQLLKIVAGKRAQMMVVGDVDQCIYEWRGARPDYITSRFVHDFPRARDYLLSHTFRFGHGLSLAANHLITKNKKRDRKLCVSHSSTSTTEIVLRPVLKKHPLPELLRDWQNEGRRLDEVVVLVRLFGLAVPVELALLDAGIDYHLEGSNTVFECQETLALRGYAELAAGTLGGKDAGKREQMIRAMLAVPHPGLGREEMERLFAAITVNPEDGPQVFLQWSGSDVPPYIKKRFTAAAQTWQWLLSDRHRTHPPKAGPFLKRIAERFGLNDFFHSFAARAQGAENRIQICEAFIDFAMQSGLSLPDFLQEITGLQEKSREERGESVLITSVHRAKGLEWPLVVLAGLEEGNFPFTGDSLVPGGAEELEDERRLYYVAMTRAREQLILLHPPDGRLQRSISSASGSLPLDTILASRFLYESNLGLSRAVGMSIEQRKPIVVTGDGGNIVQKYVAELGLEMQSRPQERSKEQEEPEELHPPLQINEIGEGMRVFHPSYGTGTVLQVEDRKQGRIRLVFDGHTEMILLVRYAKLQAVQTRS